jgi:hypothetical protein
LARQAWRARHTALAKDSPARRWSLASPVHSRATINTLFSLNDQAGAWPASAPFRLMLDDDGAPWIAAAVGPDWHLQWTHLDILDVILWNPQTGETRVAGEAPRTRHLIIPAHPDERCTVFGDTAAYFKAWAWRRLRANTGHSQRPEPHPDGNLPGVLVIGDAMQPGWTRVEALTLIAGAGVSQSHLFNAVLASRNMPIITEEAHGHGQ